VGISSNDELQVHVLQRVLGLTQGQHVGAGCGQRTSHLRGGGVRVGDGEQVAGGWSCGPTLHARDPGECGCRIRQVDPQPHAQGPGEHPGAQFVGPTDEPQRGVHDRDAVAEWLGLLQPVGGQEDRHPPFPHGGDQPIDLSRGHRVQPGGGLVQKQHRRIVQQRPGQRDALPQTLGQRPAQVAGPRRQVHRRQRLADLLARVAQLVQARKALQVLGDGQPRIQPRRLGHDRDPLPDQPIGLRA